MSFRKETQQEKKNLRARIGIVLALAMLIAIGAAWLPAPAVEADSCDYEDPVSDTGWVRTAAARAEESRGRCEDDEHCREFCLFSCDGFAHGTRVFECFKN